MSQQESSKRDDFSNSPGAVIIDAQFADLSYDKVSEPLEIDDGLNLDLESENDDDNSNFSNKRFRRYIGFVFISFLFCIIVAIVVYSLLNRQYYLGAGCRSYFRNETNSTDDDLWQNNTIRICD